MLTNVKFHHYGLAVKRFKEAIQFHNTLGYSCGEIVIDNLQYVELVLCSSPHYPSVELVMPFGDNSPINSFLKKNNEIIYHICYEINIADISIDQFFSGNRYICVSEPKPAILFNNRLVSFYYINNVGLIEILEK